MSLVLQFTAAFGLAHAGFVALSQTKSRHYGQAHRRPMTVGARRKLQFSVLGSLGLAASLMGCVAWKGGPIGITMWLGTLTLAATAVVLLLAYRARWTVFAGMLAALVGIASAALNAAASCCTS